MIHLREELKRNQLTIDLFWLHSENGIDGFDKQNEIERNRIFLSTI